MIIDIYMSAPFKRRLSENVNNCNKLDTKNVFPLIVTDIPNLRTLQNQNKSYILKVHQHIYEKCVRKEAHVHQKFTNVEVNLIRICYQCCHLYLMYDVGTVLVSTKISVVRPQNNSGGF